MLKTEPGIFETTGGNSRGILGAPYTGRSIDVEEGYGRAAKWLKHFERTRKTLPDIEAQFLESIAGGREGKMSEPLFRGQYLLENDPKSIKRLGPPPAKFTKAGRYNKKGHPVLYLCTSIDGVLQELEGSRRLASKLWTLRFRLPAELRLLDARPFSEYSFLEAVFWVIESDRFGRKPRLGARVAELVGRHFDGMLVPGVRADKGPRYSNVVIFRPGRNWRLLVEESAKPILHQ